MRIKLAQVIVIIGTACLVSLLVIFAWAHYPVSNVDSQFYWTPALTGAAGHGLVNDFSISTRDFDNKGANRLVYHGYLFPLLVGKMVWRADYSQIRIAISLLLASSLVLTALHFWRNSAGIEATPWLRSLIIVAASSALASFLIGHQGRAETLAALILSAVLISAPHIPESSRWLLFGAALGLLAGTHPVGCILAADGIAMATFCRRNFASALVSLGAAALVAGAVWALTFAFYPYSLADWLSGLRANGANVLPGAAGLDASLWFRWIRQQNSSFYGPICFVALAMFVQHAWSVRRTIRSPAPAAACAAVLAGAFYIYGIRKPVQNYNLLLFTPAIFGYILSRLTLEASKAKVAGVLVLFCLGSLGFAQRLAVFPFYLRDGLGWEAACRRVKEIVDESPEKVGVTGDLFTLTSDYSHAEGENGQKLLIVQQINRESLTPVAVAGYDLVESNFSPVRPRFLGLPLANTVNAWNFAIYRKQTANP